MPLIFKSPHDTALPMGAPVPDSPEHAANVEFAQTLGSSFVRENTMAAYSAWARGYPGAPTDEEVTLLRSGEFNPLEAIVGTEWDSDDYKTTVAKARSQRELDWMIKNFENEKFNSDIMANSSTTAGVIATIMAGGADPMMAPAYAIPAVKGTLMARSFKEGAIAAGSMAASEAALHQVQPTRTPEESALNIGGAGVLGMVLGPLAGRANPDEAKRLAQDTEIQDAGNSAVLSGGSIGAARTDDVPLPESFYTDLRTRVEAGEITNEDAARMVRNEKLRMTQLRRPWLMNVFSFMSPQLRTATSQSVTARNVAESAFEDPYIREKNAFGYTSGVAAETHAKGLRDANVARAHEILDEEWQAYRVGGGEIEDFDEFVEQTWDAWRHGQHADPGVAQAGSRIKSEIFDPFEKELLDQKLIPTRTVGEGDEASTVARTPAGDTNYAPRMWDFDKILSDRVGFKNSIKNYVKRQFDEAGQMDEWAVLEPEIDVRLDDTIDKITGAPHGFSNVGDSLGVPGHLKERTIQIPTDALRDWLVRDPRDITRAYFTSMAPRAVFNRRFGDWSMSDQLNQVRYEYDQLIQAEKPGTRKYKKLTREANRVIRDLTAMRDITMGMYRRPEDPTSAWHNLGRWVRTLNYVSSLGGMTVASVPDIGNVVARIGFKQFARGMGQLAFMPKAFGMAKAEAGRYAVGLDAVLHSRAHSLSMMEDGYTKTRLTDRIAGTFSRWTFMDKWNSSLKQFAGVIYMDDLGRLLQRESLTPSQTTKLAAAGIDENMWNRIRTQWQAHGDQIQGVRTPNLGNWTDDEAAGILRGAMLKEVDTAVVTPSAGDLPLVSRSQVGKIIFQFKSFAMSAQNRILLAGLQRADADMVMGWTMMMALGAGVYGFRVWNRGQEPSTDWRQLAYESWTRSGMAGYMGDIDNLAEKLTSGKISAQRALGLEAPVSKYAHRSILNDLLGPTAGRVQDISRIMAALSQGEISESDIRAMRRMLPYQNLFYLRRLLNEVEQAAAEEFAT